MVVKKDKKTGTYIVDVSNGFNAVTNKRNRVIKRGIKTRKEAIEIENYLRISKLTDMPATKGVTMDILFKIMEEEDKKANRKSSYVQTQQYNYNKHFKEYFKTAKIEKLTSQDVETFRQTLLDTGLSRNTVNKQIVLLKKILNVATSRNYLKKNPCTELKQLEVDKYKAEYWKPEDFTVFFSLFNNDESHYKLIFEFAFTTGMRIGEILALDWYDIDLKKGRINVSKTLVNIKGSTITNAPKTKAGTRYVTIHDRLVKHLSIWKDEQMNQLKSFVDDTNSLQIFQNTPEPINRYKVTNKYNTILKRTTKLKRIRIHDFRHSHVAFLLSRKANTTHISKRLGHSSNEVTYKLYGHLYEETQKEMSDMFDEIEYMV